MTEEDSIKHEMLEVKQEPIEESICTWTGLSEGIIINVKEEINTTPYYQQVKQESMIGIKEKSSVFKEELETKEEFFDEYGDTELFVPKEQAKQEGVEESMASLIGIREKSYVFKEELETKEEFFDDYGDTELFVPKEQQAKQVEGEVSMASLIGIREKSSVFKEEVEMKEEFFDEYGNTEHFVPKEQVTSISETLEREDPPIDNERERRGELQQDRDQVNSRATTGKTIRRRADPPELQDAAKQMKNAFDTLNAVLNKKNDVEDECDVFGKLIAKKLKKLSEDDREDVMFDIEKIFHSRSVELRPCRPPSNYSVNSTSSSHHSLTMMSPSSESPLSFQQLEPIHYENSHLELSNLHFQSTKNQGTDLIQLAFMNA